MWNGVDPDPEKKEMLDELCADDPAASLTAADAIAAAHDALLASPARLRLLSLDDLCLADHRPNHPGRVDLPSWRRRLPLSVDEIPIPEHVEPPTPD